MNGRVANGWPKRAFLHGCVATVICLFALLRHIDSSPIVADGKENLNAASNMIRHGVFSGVYQHVAPPPPDMKREPAWPLLVAAVLVLSGLDQIEPNQLATEHQAALKGMNVVFLALLGGLSASLAWVWTRRPVVAWSIAITLTLAAVSTTPRLVNKFNNEPLAMLLVLAGSALVFLVPKGTWRSALSLGLTLGFLTLTKAQFLYVALVPIITVGFLSRKQAGFALLAFTLVISPWIARNTLLFGEPAIAERGKTVAAVRLIMVAEHRVSEIPCMAFAFTHPHWREQVGRMLSVGPRDFNEGARCERFNREMCFDMGTEKVSCNAFPKDLAAMKSAAWREATQYFFRGTAAGQEIEANRLRLTDVAPLSLDNAVRYVQTLPLFAWRGWGFSAFPWLSLPLVLSMFALVLTRFWPFAILAASTHLFHLALTHNIPRYHAVEFGVMIVAASVLFDKGLTYLIDRGN